MTISTTTSRVSYQGNGATTAFAFPYRFDLETDLVVIIVDSDDVETTQTLTTHYTTSGAGSDSGGTVTMLTAPAADETLVIYREVDITQETDYISGDPFPAETHETALDKLTMIAQQLDTRVSRTMRLSEGTEGVDLVLPDAEAGLVIGWDGNATGLVNYASPQTVLGATQAREVQTATAGQTVFNLNYITYNVGQNNLTVHVNGVRQINGVGEAYTETDTNTVTFASGLDAGDKVEFATNTILSTINVDPTNSTVATGSVAATAGQTVFTSGTVANKTYLSGTNQLEVYVNGVLMRKDVDYNESTDNNTVTFTSGLIAGDIVTMRVNAFTDSNSADAANVTYTQGATGSVQSNVATKLRETISVLDFGAVGDGVTDDTAAIQAAIDAAEAAGGGVVNIPDGNYLYTGLTIAADDITLRGRSQGKSKLIYNSATGDGITVGTASTTHYRVLIENLWLAQVSGTERTSGAHLRLYNFTESVARDLYLTDFYEGITCEGAARSEITDVWFRKENARTAQSATAIDLKYNTTSTTGITNMKITRADGVVSGAGNIATFIKLNYADWVLINDSHVNLADLGLHINTDYTMHDLWVSNTYFDYAESGNVLMEGTAAISIQDIIFDNCYFRASQGYGFRANSTNIAIDNLKFANCRFKGARTHGIFFGAENTTYLNIDGCTFIDNGQSATGNAIDSSAVRTRISNCIFRDNDGAYDVNVGLASPAGSLIIANCNFAASAATVAKVNHSNISIVAIENNIGIIPESRYTNIDTLADDATPSVVGPSKYWLTGGTTTITDFDDGFTGQEIVIIAEHAITITDGTNIFLNGSTNFVMAATDTLTLVQKADGLWYETARSDNT